jgi:hypothetical protein
MEHKPGDLFLTITDVFVLLLPGVLLIALSDFVVMPSPFFTIDLTDARGWLAFALAAYVLGHLISGVAAVIEDWYYGTARGQRAIEDVRPATRDTVAKRLAELPNGGWSADGNIRRAAALLVQLQSSQAAMHLLRRDADRRFFRNFIVTVVLLVLLWAIAWMVPGVQPAPAVRVVPAAAALLILALLRYADQNKKYTRDVFDYFLALDSVGGLKTARVERDAG